MKKIAISLVLPLFGLLGCPANNPPIDPGDEDDDGSADARLRVKNYINGELTLLNDSAAALQSFAPDGDANGWNPADDLQAVLTMKGQWKNARLSYERVEGAIAVLFPGLDASTDERWDGFIGEAADANLFDDDGVTGVHGVERILFADQVPANVLTFEQGVGDGFVPSRFTAPAFPANLAESTDFKTKLVQRLVDDTATMKEEFLDVDLALEAAFRGVLGSMEEQAEKVNLAGTGEDESRYAQHTLADMRANLEGGLEIYEAFDKMFEAKGAQGEALHEEIHEAFERVKAQYDGIAGDAIPAVPATWNPDAPSVEDQASEYGALFLFLADETDFENPASFVSLFREGAELLEIPELAE
ncbi:MAG: imelysin family protein [Deltaproteobacteria bacterium]|nr:imelysin family protein [Deltaproteobacteria bacterium]